MYCNKCNLESHGEDFCSKCGHNGYGVYETPKKAISAFRKACIPEKIRFILFFVWNTVIPLSFAPFFLGVLISFCGKILADSDMYVMEILFSALSYVLVLACSYVTIPFYVFDLISSLKLSSFISSNGIDTRETVDKNKKSSTQRLIESQLLVDKPSTKPLLIVQRILTIVCLQSAFQAMGTIFLVSGFIYTPLSNIFTIFMASRFTGSFLAEPSSWYMAFFFLFLFVLLICIFISYFISLLPQIVVSRILNEKAKKNFYGQIDEE